MTIGGGNITLIGNGNPDGCTIGQTAAELVSFHGVTPVAQAAVIAGVATTGATTELAAVETAVNAILVAMKAKGLVATA